MLGAMGDLSHLGRVGGRLSALGSALIMLSVAILGLCVAVPVLLLLAVILWTLSEPVAVAAGVIALYVTVTTVWRHHDRHSGRA